MQILASGKQIDIGDSLRAYVKAQMTALVEKYFQNPIRSNVVFTRESRLFRVDVCVDVGRALSFESHAEASEPYVAFDLALDHTAKQLRRQKRKLRNHRPK